MTNNREQVSTFMDNELNQADLEALLSDEESQTTWEHFHMIGDTLRGDADLVPQGFNIANNIAAALNDELSHRAEPKDEALNADVSILVEAQPSPSKTRRELPAWLSNMMQVGMAACVTLVVVLGVQQYSGSSDVESSPNALPVLQTVPLAGIAEPVSLTSESLQAHSHQQVADTKSQEAQAIDKYRKINALMQDYELQRRLNSGQP